MIYSIVYSDLLIRVVLFCVFTLESYRHFVIPSPEPLGMKVIRVFSLVAFAANIYMSLFGDAHEKLIFLSLLGVSLGLVSGVLFFLTLRETKQLRLQIAFSEQTSFKLVTEGPFGHVRHPFYASYMLFWWSWCLITTRPISLVFAAVLSFLYFRSIHIEEASMYQEFSKEFSDYRANTPSILPKLLWSIRGVPVNYLSKALIFSTYLLAALVLSFALFQVLVLYYTPFFK